MSCSWAPWKRPRSRDRLFYEIWQEESRTLSGGGLRASKAAWRSLEHCREAVREQRPLLAETPGAKPRKVPSRHPGCPAQVSGLGYSKYLDVFHCNDYHWLEYHCMQVVLDIQWWYTSLFAPLSMLDSPATCRQRHPALQRSAALSKLALSRAVWNRYVSLCSTRRVQSTHRASVWHIAWRTTCGKALLDTHMICAIGTYPGCLLNMQVLSRWYVCICMYIHMYMYMYIYIYIYTHTGFP